MMEKVLMLDAEEERKKNGKLTIKPQLKTGAPGIPRLFLLLALFLIVRPRFHHSCNTSVLLLRQPRDLQKGLP